MNPKTTILTLSCLLALCINAVGEEKKPDDTMERVLALDNFALAESLGDTSEAGQNDAARLQAGARRIRTETRLAKQSMRRVIVAAGWRRALNLWYDAQYEMIYLHEGGGTMWLHFMARNVIQVEEFLEGVADGLPVEPSEVSEEIQTRLQTLFDESNARLKQAAASARKHRALNDTVVERNQTRLKSAQMELQHAFQFAGDKATTEKLLNECSKYADIWDVVLD